MTQCLILITVGACFTFPTSAQETQAADSVDHQRRGFEFLPILSYDTDVGFGYGAKVFLLNRLSLHESFDIVLFHSTKGERAYRFVASFPDVELRQRTSYPCAFDVLVEYDRLINANFFGVGNSSLYGARETYARTFFEISVTTSRGFTPTFVGQTLIQYRSVRNSNIDPSGNLGTQGETSMGRAISIFMGFSLRYDTRNSAVNPSTGTVLLAEGGWAPQWNSGTVSFSRWGFWTQEYVSFHNIVFAGRVGLQQIGGANLPVQMLLPIGGGNTLRGYPQDRYLDRMSVIINLEARFMIVWRLGAIVGWDAGKVWRSPDKMDLTSWPNNPTVGLRLIMDNFVARLDVGFSRETTGLYLNFGHLF